MEIESGVEIVGRGEELAALTEFLDAADRLPATLLIRGEAGIGKTTLWEGALARGRERSFRVLSHRASAAEVQLSYAALGDLLRDVAEEALAELPAPQRRGLEVALLLADAGERPPEPQAIAAGFSGALSRLALTGPLLVAVDDVQWLDPSSATTLAFALRRLRDEPIAVVLAQRVEDALSSPLALGREIPEALLRRLEVSPLSLGALHRLVTARIGVTFTRPTLHRLYEISGGNPFFALELARALARRGARLEPGEPWPLPTDLHELLRDRLAALPSATRGALLTVAGLSQPTVALVEEALEGEAEIILQPAFDAQVIEVHAEAIRFSHPLLASAVQRLASRAAQRSCHRRLAEIVDDAEERARHLALATVGADPDAADALHEAALHARRRGAPAAAAELYEHALRLTPARAGERGALRTVEAADAYQESGDRGRASALLEPLLERLAPGGIRIDVLIRLAELADSSDRGIQLAEQAVTEAGLDGRRRAQTLIRLAENETPRANFERGLSAAREAADLAEAGRHDDLLSRALTLVGAFEGIIGLGNPEDRFRRALAVRPEGGVPAAPQGTYWATETQLALWLLRSGRLAESRDLLEQQHRRAVAVGDEESRALLQLHLTEVDCASGDWDRALAYATEGHELDEQTGGQEGRAASCYGLALVEARLGNAELARSLAEDGLAIAESLRYESWTILNRRVLGFLELSLGRHADASARFADLATTEAVEGLGRLTFVGDAIEALLGLGEVEEAADLVGKLELRAQRLQRAPLLAFAAHSAGLLKAARDDLPGATTSLTGASERWEELGMPFERARTLLALGQVQRRAQQKRAARESLEVALAGFEQLGAKLWADRARAELARIGGRVPTGELTPTERRVAELVAQGLSNKEVAAQLVVGVRAVEANLTRIYTKLGIGSRSQLARHWAEQAVEKPHT